jgi:hypothetical protein
MIHTRTRWLPCLLVLLLGRLVRGQDSESSAPEVRGHTPAASSPAEPTAEGTQEAPSWSASGSPDRSFFDRLLASLSQEEDPDGPISTDRPTFTPANTVVPRRRLQFESGFTFNNEEARGARTTVYDLPELAMRYGLSSRIEFRTFWLGPTWSQTQTRPRRPRRPGGGLSDMEVGFKWQLFSGDKERKWIPVTALITSIFAPTGGSSTLGSHTVEPYINLIYGWSLSEKLTLCGSTGYLGIRETDLGRGVPADNFQRWHQSLVAFYSARERITLFYEWYGLWFTNAADNRPSYFVDGGLLYRLTTNMQLDLRAGFGLTGRPDDFFTGVGYSVRF